MNVNFLQSALRQTQTNLSNPRLYAVFGIVVLIFAVSGPFGTYEGFNLPHRLGLWFLIHAVTWTVAIFSLSVFDHTFGKSFPNAWARLLIGGTVAAFPVAAVTIALETILHGRQPDFGIENWTSALMSAVPLTLAFSVLSTLAADWKEGPATNTYSSAPEQKAPMPELPKSEIPQAPALLARLPLEKRGALIRLSAADHYVEVVTENGMHLILMRLADAVAETAPTQGRMVHRSHWVADKAISSMRGGVGKAKLSLINGQTVPVSRVMTDVIRAVITGRRT